MIRVRGLHKRYVTGFGVNHVLADVSFDVVKGRRMGVLGRNGAGKSTLMRLVSGAEQPSAGTIERNMSVSWPLAFGGAFQAELSGRDNVRFISRLYNQNFARNVAFVEDFAELGPYLREPVRTYSSGMRARLAFAISMIIEFDCFLIDEVNAVGDARFHERCDFELFTKRADRAMIIISHDPGYLRKHCNSFALLHESRLTVYDDFDLAYDRYAQLVSLHEQPIFAPRIDRASTRDALLRVANGDERFRVHVNRGDWARDAGEWTTAEREYAAALRLHPYACTYWSQHGHSLRAQSKFRAAEISYRNACALGQPVTEVWPFLVDVMAHQAVREDDFPVRAPAAGPIWRQPPCSHDIDVLARAFCRNQVLSQADTHRLMRQSTTLDDLACTLVAMAAGRQPSQCDARSDDAITGAIGVEDTEWLADLCRLAKPNFSISDRDTVYRRFDRLADVVPNLLHAGGFADWPATVTALQSAASHLRYVTSDR